MCVCVFVFVSVHKDLCIKLCKICRKYIKNDAGLAVLVLFLNIHFMYLKDTVIYREKRDGDRLLCLLVHSMNGLNSQGWDRLKPGASSMSSTWA